eukprot:3935226-Rhodomonas_salina.1
MPGTDVVYVLSISLPAYARSYAMPSTDVANRGTRLIFGKQAYLKNAWDEGCGLRVDGGRIERGDAQALLFNKGIPRQERTRGYLDRYSQAACYYQELAGRDDCSYILNQLLRQQCQLTKPLRVPSYEEGTDIGIRCYQGQLKALKALRAFRYALLSAYGWYLYCQGVCTYGEKGSFVYCYAERSVQSQPCHFCGNKGLQLRNENVHFIPKFTYCISCPRCRVLSQRMAVWQNA